MALQRVPVPLFRSQVSEELHGHAFAEEALRRHYQREQDQNRRPRSAAIAWAAAAVLLVILALWAAIR